MLAGMVTVGQNRPRIVVYKEIYWLKGQNTPKPLSVAGFNEPPFMAARWATVSNEAYGRPCPCMTSACGGFDLDLDASPRPVMHGHGRP